MASSFSEFQEYMVTVGGKNFWTAHAFGKDSGFDAVFATKFDSCNYRMLNGGNHNQNLMGSMGRYTNPLKEFLKHSMLQHEAIFKEQVYELHRLYWTQKNLMNTHNMKENCTAWDMGPQLSSVSLQNKRRDSQSEGVNFIPPLNPMMSTVQADNRIMVEHCQGSSSTLHQSQRRRVAIDLELPGEDYISDDEFMKDQKQGEVQNPAQHEMVVFPENMKVRLNRNEKICADETTVRINLFNQGFSSADRGAINLEEYAEEAKMVASFDLEAPPACQGGIHGLVQHSLHDTRREDLDSMSLMKCSTMDQSERREGKISYHYDSECNISSGSHDDKLFTQKQNTNQSCRALLDLNEALPDESSIIVPATIGHPSPSESSSGHGRSVSVESHFHFQPVTTFLGIRSSTCSKETPSSVQDNALYFGSMNSQDGSSNVPSLGCQISVAGSSQTSIETAKLTKSNSIPGGTLSPLTPLSQLQCQEERHGEAEIPSCQITEMSVEKGGPTSLSDGSALLSSSLPNGPVYDGSQRAFSDVNPGNAVDDNLNSSVGSMEADLGSKKAKLDSCKEDSLSLNPSRIQVAGTVMGHSSSSHDYDQCVTGVLDAQNPALSTTKDSSAVVQDEMEGQLQEEAPKVDPAVTGAAEILIQLLLAKSPSSSNCFTDVKHGSLEATDELSDDSSDSYESIVLGLPESQVDDYTSAVGVIVKESGNEKCSSRPRRARKQRDFQREILPSLVSLSRHEICEDLHFMLAVDGLNESRRSSQRKAGEHKWCIPARRRRTRTCYGVHRD